MQKSIHAPISLQSQILVCDDDEEYSCELIEALETSGFHAALLPAAHLTEGAVPPNTVLLLDLCMPERNAIDVAKILDRCPNRSTIRIVLATGCSQPIIDSVSRQFEMRGLNLIGALQKPIDFHQLLSLLR